jgi:ATP-dependent Lon protease
VAEIPMEIVEDKKIEALLFNIRAQFQKLVTSTELPQELVATVNSLTNPFYVAYLVSSQLNLKIENGAGDPGDRAPARSAPPGGQGT